MAFGLAVITGSIEERGLGQNKGIMVSVETISKILMEYDPIHLYFEDVDNADEYKFEAERILEGVPGCVSEESCLDLVWDVFRAQFGEEAACGRDNYVELSRVLWRHLNSASSRE